MFQQIIKRLTTMATRPKVLVTHPDLPEKALDILKKSCDVILCTKSNEQTEPTREEILSKSKGVDGILWATHCKLNAEALDAAGPQLKSISTKSAGIDYVDVPEVKRRAIPLGYTPEILNDAVADVAIGLLISASRRFYEGRMLIDRGQWKQGDPNWMLGQDIRGSTVGIVGLGGIGQTVARRLKSFNIGELVYTGNGPKPAGDELGAKYLNFNDLLNVSDFVVVSCPLNDTTRGMFNESAFSKMKPTSVFINVARGDIVNQEALINALKTKKIFAAGLDVTTPEPLPVDHPLLKLDNCVIVPHIGSATATTEFNMATIAAHNVLRGLVGEPMLSPVP